MKWYDENESDSSVVVASRIRLVRNLKAYKFPGTLSRQEKDELTEKLNKSLFRLSAADGRTYEQCRLEKLDQVHREALRERQIIGRASVLEPAGVGLVLSKDEAVSVTVNSIDHIRIQVSKMGMELQQIWAQIDKLDDCVNEMYPYAFHEKVGYMSAYPTNIGTGMKAYLILHLPLLETAAKFSELVGEIDRYGVKLRPAFANRESSGSLYVLFNQKTLGVSEQDVIQIMEKVSGQLMSQEKNLQKHSVGHHRITVEDLCYKAYGSLRYARLMSLQSGMQLLSQLRWGQEQRIISFESYCNLYELMIGIQPANLSVFYEKELKREEQDGARAQYIRRFLPKLKE